jgi:hypothetical protein
MHLISDKKTAFSQQKSTKNTFFVVFYFIHKKDLVMMSSLVSISKQVVIKKFPASLILCS